MNVIVRITAVALLAVGLGGLVGTAFAKDHAKISKEQAQKIALEQAPGGKVKSSELEQEKGALVWSFDISMPGTRDVTEVLVNAETGAVVEVSKETPDQQDAEEREEAKEDKSK